MTRLAPQLFQQRLRQSRSSYTKNTPCASTASLLGNWAGRFLLAILAALWLMPLSSAAASGNPRPEQGLLITPLRQYLSVDAGKSTQSSLSVANLTDKPLDVNLSVRQFSVTDYTYNYTFGNPTNDWLHLGVTSVHLQPNQTSQIPYSLTVPSGSTPGGRYYTLFASANLSSQGLNNTIQAADLVYLTVNGTLTRTSHLQHSSIPWLAFGHSISFSLQPINTGNIYFFAYVSGQLHGLSAKATIAPETHLLMPGAVRTIEGSIPSPVLPGLYKATYGYKTDAGQSVMQSHLVIFVPPWSIALLLAAFLLLGRLLSRKKHPNPSKPTPDDSNDNN